VIEKNLIIFKQNLWAREKFVIGTCNDLILHIMAIQFVMENLDGQFPFCGPFSRMERFWS